MSLPFWKIGIAHPACGLIDKRSRKNNIEILNLLSEQDMKRIFTKTASLGCGIELNQSDMSFKDDEADTVLRPFRIAKNCGCKFYLGSDAHHPSTFEKTAEIFGRAINLLNLSENDKFHISRK